MNSKTEYSSSTLVEKFKKSPNPGSTGAKNLKLAFLDIDNTLTGKVHVVNKVRKELENLGFGIILVSARTEEMLMSNKLYLLSKKLGFKRPPAKLNKKEPSGILDPDIIIGSSGTAILIKQQSGGYLIDKDYQEKMNNFINWRKNSLKLLKKIDPKNQFYFFPKIEDPKNYYQDLVDVLTPEFRIQLNFKTAQNKEFIYKALLASLRGRSGQQVERENYLNLSDDSDERKDKYSIFLTPRGITKGKAVNQVIKNLCQDFNLEREDLEILFAGDSLADLDMGYLEKEVSKSTFLLVGGSRLSLKQIKEFTSTIPGIPPKKFIIGDQIFPKTLGPQTILSFLSHSSF